MYNGIGLQTPRGSGTNGYIQTSKFFVKSRPPVRQDAAASGSKPEGAVRKPNKDILEHDRKRQIQLKLLILQETLTDQGYTDAEIAEKLEETKKTLEAESAAAEDGGSSGDRRDLPSLSNKRFADTQSHHIAARKEKQMETLKAALGIKDEKKSSEDEQQGQIMLNEEEYLEPGEFGDDKSEQGQAARKEGNASAPRRCARRRKRQRDSSWGAPCGREAEGERRRREIAEPEPCFMHTKSKTTSYALTLIR
ncbi:pre-mRNA-splicing factor CWC21-like [Curcuma longa]|uniref:pre-mRNA-splicing factor CWC21-like n=1 Tax=Curcuma longa TaxID=136217 RepID=UPI003D9EF47E